MRERERVCEFLCCHIWFSNRITMTNEEIEKWEERELRVT